MKNIPKYLSAIESINLISDDKDELPRIKKNLEILSTLIKHDEIIDILSEAFKLEATSQNNPGWRYSLYIYQILLSVIDEVDFDSDSKEDLISTKHVNLLIDAIQDVSGFGLRANLHSILIEHPIFAPIPTKSPPSTQNLIVSLKAFRKILAIRKFHVGGNLSIVTRDYIAGILTIIEHDLEKKIQLTEPQRKLYQSDLNAIWNESSKCDYFRNILLFRGLPNLPPALQKRLHFELLNKLMAKGGFTYFVSTLLMKRTAVDAAECDYFEVVANIVAHPKHSNKFYLCLIEQIFEFLNLCISNSNMAFCMGAGLLTLKKLYELKVDTQKAITERLDKVFEKLAHPEDIISGLIVMEHKELTFLSNFLFTCFCSSSMECLPSEMLTKYLPLLLSVYSFIPDKFKEQVQIRGVIVRCLANRSRNELDKIVNALVAKKYPDEWVQLHPRVSILPDSTFSQLTVKINSPDAKPEELNISNVLPEILTLSNHNILTYIVFMCLLGMMQEALTKDDDDNLDASIDLLHSEEELVTFLNSKYPIKVEIVLCLSTLVNHSGLKAQISENSSEFLDFLRTFIQRRGGQSLGNQESTDHTLLLLLTITQEMIENSEIPEKYRDFTKVLKELRKQTPNELIVHRIDKLLHLLEGGLKASFVNRTSQYNQARDLMKEREAHLKAYGINLMIEMLRQNDKDAEANGHVTLALALHALKEPESYVFLNCVRLFVALLNVMETEVLETLSDEYLNRDNKIDYRLVVGEAILKVTRELGQLSYKYKDVLLNCFINGCRSDSNEFRWSSFSNLATLCKLLTFQVHSFFQELLLLIENEIQTGKYSPSKRAAVLVLSELLLGMENLLDHEEYLLPIYRVLKTLSTDSDDEKIRLHAANGLKALGDKCKKFLFPEEKREKEIKIIGIKDSPQMTIKNKNQKPHILELN
ncbi:transport and Golgi organization protein 6 [Episyrphus balteatus]|uniref:transport and Golgi organization protein 6 n=1 Tax=Episyrphus balteatus TaxID=286459 RepID=UPI0024859CE4|nr:transport and Golgi organization protein 6 [Episyrphus balteatus]